MGIKDFFKGAIRFYVTNIEALIRELLPHYVFSQNWEICDTEGMEEVLHVYKYWMGVELSHKEYVLKRNSLSPDEQKKVIMGRIQLLRRMYRELPSELQKEIIQ